MWTALSAFLLGQEPPEFRLNAQRLKEVFGHHQAGDSLWLAAARQRPFPVAEEWVIAGDLLEGAIVALELFIRGYGVGHAGKTADVAACGNGLAPGREPGELLRLGKWQRPQQNRVHHAEYCGVGRDAQRQDQHGDDRKPAILSQRAQAVAKVLCARAPVVPALDVPLPFLAQPFARLAHRFEVAELPLRFTLRRIPAPAPLDQVVHLGLEMKLQLVLHIGRRIRAEHPRVAPPHRDPRHQLSSNKGDLVALSILPTAAA